MANVSSFSGAMPVIPGGLVELGYSQITSPVNVTSTSFTYPNTVIAPLTVVCDGSPVLVEFFASHISAAGTGTNMALALYQDGAELDRYWGYTNTVTAALDYKPVHLQRRVTPSAGSHTFAVWGQVAGGTGEVRAGTGGATTVSPAFLRVSKIVSQNDGLKPFWKPPIVTQLPALAQSGDQVVYAADATNGVYWLLQYDGLGTYPWKFIGGAPMFNSNSNYPASQSTSSYTNITSGPSVTPVLSGDYTVRHWGQIDIINPVRELCFLISTATSSVAASDEGAANVGSQATYTGYARTSWYAERLMSAIPANEAITIQQKYAVGAQTAVFQKGGIEVTPRRVKAA